MKLWESYDRGLIHSATRLVVPPMATQSGDDGFPGARTVVILTGGVRTPEEAEALLEEGAADFIGVGRAMLQNPAWGLHK